MFLNDPLVLNKIRFTNLLTKAKNSELFDEIIYGLTQENKYISSKFFYNDRGSELFEEITDLKEYYPTRTEKSILKNIASKLFGNLHHTDIIELGSGDCSKISLLLDAIPSNNLDTINYIPVDVSQSALEKAAKELAYKYNQLNIQVVVADFLKNFNYLDRKNPKMICFLGSTIGNLTKKQAKSFIDEIAASMKPGDQFLMGLDMVKDTPFIEAAYNDEKGITAKFNLNILNAVNQITCANFNADQFNHLAFFNKEESRIEMHLVAKTEMRINIPSNGTVIDVAKGEHIHTENSHKFTKESILKFTESNNLVLKQIFNDSNKYFSLCLFSKSDS